MQKKGHLSLRESQQDFVIASSRGCGCITLDHQEISKFRSNLFMEICKINGFEFQSDKVEECCQ